MRKINFILGIHNHQPIGNFEGIFEQAYQQAYLPFLEVLEKHPGVKVNLHFSGILLEWIVAHHPELVLLLKKLIAGGQIELMTGGYYEPILAMLSEQDSIEQIEKLTEYIEHLFDCSPRGMWLAERVWEPHLAKVISRAGVEYTVVDDLPFKYAGLFEEDLLGYYITEEDGYPLKVFPISEKLRFLIPFRKVSETIDYFASNAAEREERLLVMADDGEKFGIWPGTHDLVYKQKWLEEFFFELEKNRDWIRMFTFSEYISKFPARGRIYLPTGSYSQMMEWVLPTRARREYTNLQRELEKSPDGQRYARFIKGGFWRNFFVKYEESNWMQKKMLLVSKRIAQVRQGLENSRKRNTVSVNSRRKSELLPHWLKQARDELWKGQCNCAYWHGVFGGLYFPHLRKAVYAHLIKAEKILDEKLNTGSQWVRKEELDFDLDGKKEVLINTSKINAYFKPSKGASLFELDYKPQCVNLVATLTRRKEAYHEEIIRASLFNNSRTSAQNKDVKSIHHLEKVKNKDLVKYLHYDWYERVSFIDHFLHPDTKVDDFSICQYGEQGDFVDQPYNYEIEQGAVTFWRDGLVWIGDFQQRVRVEKKIEIPLDSNQVRAIYKVTNKGQNRVDLWFGCELNFSFSSPENEKCYYYIPQGEEKKAFSSWGEILLLKKIEMFDEYQNVHITLDVSPESGLWYFPVETISEGDLAYERMYQGSAVFPHWKLSLESGQTQEIQLKLTIEDIR